LNRIIPILLLKDRGFYKSTKFKKHRYIGDPINILKIFNEKGIDEAVIFDISARERESIDFEYLEEIASECFFPLSYGGFINEYEDARKVIELGFEKISFCSAFFRNPELVKKCVKSFGSSSVIGTIDYKLTFFNQQRIFSENCKKHFNISLIDHVDKIASTGVGEIILNNVDLDGSRKGIKCDDLLNSISRYDQQFVFSCGASSHQEILDLAKRHKNYSFAGSTIFVYSSEQNGVLITYPFRDYDEMF